MDTKLVEFSNLLRQNGLRVSLAESMDMLRALAVVGLPDRQTVRATLRATMVKRSVDLPTFETLFDLFFSGLADAIKELTAATASALEMSEEEFQRFLAHFERARGDRKSTRLNSSHDQISYAVFCLKKKKIDIKPHRASARHSAYTAR